ncbi:GNAT family N-acetyltransferase [Mariniflexile jejuense]|uniref:GNAT family N-acetyltransferase n=1 Tax=Mariniflexile jejuense TaxID=1173582 RepID=A0ABW3JDS7_9FLAO
MGLKITNHNFFSNVFEQHKTNALYKTVCNSFNNTLLDNDVYSDNPPFNITTFKFVPNYLNTTVTTNVACSKVFLKHGYLANLKGYKNIDDYLKKDCKRNFRYKILKSVKRLESCFEINYKTYHGDNMLYQEYIHYMNIFHNMLTKRFNQRNDRNLILENWDYYFKITYNLIINKKASLFVIFNKQEPITFTLNFHCDTILYFSVPTFNLDYSKFTPGNVAIYKIIEWCFQNNYQIFDMGYGSFENKLSWCNTTYNYEHHVLYNPKNKIGKPYAFILKNKYKLINYLLAKRVNLAVKKIKNTIKGSNKEFQIPYVLLQIENTDFNQINNATKIDLNLESNNFLKKVIHDFLYLNTEHINNITVHKLQNAPKQYIFKGKETMSKIQFTY